MTPKFRNCRTFKSPWRYAPDASIEPFLREEPRLARLATASGRALLQPFMNVDLPCAALPSERRRTNMTCQGLGG